jgi:predicted nucleic acid-binding Zn ribbon protein
LRSLTKAQPIGLCDPSFHKFISCQIADIILNFDEKWQSAICREFTEFHKKKKKTVKLSRFLANGLRKLVMN